MAEPYFKSFNSLMKAIYIGMDYSDVEDYACSYECNINHLDSCNNSCLIHAVTSNYIYKDEIINLLIDKDINPNVINQSKDTALLLACLVEDIKIKTFTRLVNISNLEIRDINNHTALEFCIDNHSITQNIEKIKVLLEHGAILSTHMFLCFIRNSSETTSNQVFDIMKDYYDFSNCDKKGNNALITASFHAGDNCNFYIFEEILKLSKNFINKTNKLGETALIYASQGVASDIAIYKTVELLIENGADVDIIDKKGYTYKDYLPDKFKTLHLPRKKFFSDEAPKECSLCLEIKEELIFFESCGHGTICENCFENNIKMCQGTCHKCRAEITNVRIFRYVK